MAKYELIPPLILCTIEPERTLESQYRKEEVKAWFRAQNLIPCTACRYCTDGCPMKISIPDLFACMNAKKTFQNWNTDYYYDNVHTVNNGKASACIKCGRCEAACPRHLPIRELLVQVAEEFEH